MATIVIGVREVRKHRAPKGALRPVRADPIALALHVRKHRAPKGALRRVRQVDDIAERDASESTERQKVH